MKTPVLASNATSGTHTDGLREFFDGQQNNDQYASLKAMTHELDAEAATILNAQIAGDVLSIGGVWDFYESNDSVTELTVLDLSEEMLRVYCPAGATGVVGDLYEHDFAPKSFDTIVFPLMLHHTPLGNWKSCERRIETAVERAQRWLKPDGTLLILEYCPHPLWGPVQRTLLPFTRRFLTAFSQPLVVMYNRRFYEQVLNKQFGSSTARRIAPAGFNYRKWYPIFMSIRWLKMPLAIYPKLHVLSAPSR